MRKIFSVWFLIAVLISLLFIVPATSQISQNTLVLPAFLDSMTADYYKPSMTAALGSFTYADTQLPTPFSRWFEDELRQALTKTSKIKFFDKQVAAAMDPSIREKYQAFFGAEIVDSLIYGKYSADSGSVLVTLSITDLATGQLIAEQNLVYAASQLPQGLRVAPTMQTLQTATSLASLATGLAQADSNFKLSLSTERGLGATYRDGENLNLLITCSKDSYLKIYHVDVNGVAQLIWPNRFGGSGRIAQGEAMRFPAEGDRFTYKLGAPYGTEYIKAIASLVPFKTMEPDFLDLEGSAPVAITRGLNIESTNAANRAEALVVYEILP
jgi:hypothetical protein